MQLFYNSSLTTETTELVFSREESKHITKVLRKREGDLLSVTNGKGDLFSGEITFSSPNKCIATINHIKTTQARPYHVHLVVAPTKMNDRYEWFLEKATEIGIDEVTPIICDHSERKVIKEERFERILLSAMKQSLQLHLPKLNSAISFSDFISKQQQGQLFIAHCEETSKRSFKDTLKKNTDVTILIGPEGDFSSKEIEIALSSNFIPVTLGNTRLRTETAAIVAAHSIAYSNE
ncbi:16S rRNA (uracil(1498)-N(3))-methyltransferase [Aquimarina rhabdastrellae]